METTTGPMSSMFARLIRLGAVLLALLTAACASGGATPRPFPMPRSGPEPASPPANHETAPVDLAAAAYALVGTALEFRGVPYRNGGSSPEGFDCSGFTQYVFAQHGLILPREVRDQFGVGKSVRIDELRPGDLIFFTTTAPGASHVAIAVGGNAFVHAPSSTGVVRVERLSSRYWSARFVGVRRLSAN